MYGTLTSKGHCLGSSPILSYETYSVPGFAQASMHCSSSEYMYRLAPYVEYVPDGNMHEKTKTVHKERKSTRIVSRMAQLRKIRENRAEANTTRCTCMSVQRTFLLLKIARLNRYNVDQRAGVVPPCQTTEGERRGTYRPCRSSGATNVAACKG